MSAQAAPGLRVGVYGGAFDPPHWAHVDMAKAFVAQCVLDRLLVLPTGQAWHKANQPLSPSVHRVAMAQLAFAELPQATIDARETQRPGPSFTIDTLTELDGCYPGASWYLLVGADQWTRFTAWHRWQDIANKATIVVADRPNSPSVGLSKNLQNAPRSTSDLPDAVPLNWQQRSLSSTQIRALIEGDGPQAQWAGPMVPTAVARYISQHQLYTHTIP